MTIDNLYDSLKNRFRPEDIAEQVLNMLGDDLSKQERSVLNKAAGRSLKRLWGSWTSMSEKFHHAVSPVRQAKRAAELFRATPLKDVDCLDPEIVATYIKKITAEIPKEPGKNDFLKDRKNRKGRKAAGFEISRRQYNKLFRFLARFEKKLETYRLEARKARSAMIAKSSLASMIPYEDFTASKDAACFVAYFAARSNRRSVFTNQKQDRPFDQVASNLLERVKKKPCPGAWRAIARVMPDVEVIANLSDDDKKDVFREWTRVLEDIADILKKTWEASRFDRKKMVVERGNDSSTWNAAAGAWNKARQGWISIVTGLGMEDLLEGLSFGKVMRLMAADVVRWHDVSGGELEPDTVVWAELPAPWEVFAGNATCTKAEVEKVCRKHKVDPEKKGWTAPRKDRKAVDFKPTPELVHGVAVAHPAIALALRKAGWFSGKNGRPADIGPIEVVRDEYGFAQNVVPAKEAVPRTN